MEEITSAKNLTFKLLLKLAKSPVQRSKSGLTLFDGFKLVKDYLAIGGQPEMLIFNKAKLDKIQPLNISLSIRQIVLSSDLFNRISQVNASSGVICVAKPTKLDYRMFGYEANPVVILDRVQDPGNLGTILRSCLAFGASNVFLSSDSTDAWSPKVIRASSGACFSLNIYENSSLSDLVSRLELAGYQILATSPSAKKTLRVIDLSDKPVAWLFGNEGSGVRDELMNQVSNKVSISQSGKLESLNLAAAVAICLYEQFNYK